MKRILSNYPGYDPSELFTHEFLMKTCSSIKEKLESEYGSDYDLAVDIDDTAIEGPDMKAEFIMYDGDDEISRRTFYFNGEKWDYDNEDEFWDYLDEEIDEFVYRMQPSDDYWYE